LPSVRHLQNYADSIGVSRGSRDPAHAFTHTRLRDSNPGQRSASEKARLWTRPFRFSLYDDAPIVTAWAHSKWARRRKIDLAELIDEP